MASGTDSESLEYTPTWVVAVVCSVIVLISLLVERFLHRLGKYLRRKNMDALFQALQKLKEELMLLGFISLLLTVFQGAISDICIPENISHSMLPCKESTLVQVEHDRTDDYVKITPTRRHLLVENSKPHCSEGTVPMLSLEALHQLHIFIFVLAVVHVIFCATTMVLGGAKVELWKRWEDSIRKELRKQASDKAGTDLPARKKKTTPAFALHQRQFIIDRAMGFWSKSVVVSWLVSFFKQFYGSVTQSDYTALRSGFIKKHCSTIPEYDFHKYLLRTLQADFKKVVGISWYLWLFVVIFLLLNVSGWHAYFWLSFLPLSLLLIVGAKLEYIITRMAQEVAETEKSEGTVSVKLSDDYFWFHRPGLVLYLIHFILFQNSFEIAFFFWILSTYGFHSCIMEEVGYVVPRLIFGLIIQVLCSYSTLPLYVLVSQMGNMLKKEILNESIHSTLQDWVEDTRKRKEPDSRFSLWGKKKRGQKEEGGSSSTATQVQNMVMGPLGNASIEQSIVLEEINTSAIEHSDLRAADQI
ncbi:MLO-like protein 13 [Aristolochia californica]|uniref:MLO-like protein 13 n=1 Tax=Aristolochia californica TaxID=171875 RepID=UPI0035D57459